MTNCQKTDDFRRFWPGLTDAAADCSAPCGPIQLKFYVVNGLGYGYKRCEFSRHASRYAGAAAEKPAKTDNFRCFWPGLPDGAADCSAPCGPIWPKFYVVKRLGYGYGQCKFCRGASRYAEAAADKPAKNDDFHRFWPRLELRISARLNKFAHRRCIGPAVVPGLAARLNKFAHRRCRGPALMP